MLSHRIRIAAFLPLAVVVAGLVLRPILYATFHDGAFSMAALGLALAAGIVYDALVGVIVATPLTLALGRLPAACPRSARRPLRRVRRHRRRLVFGAFVEYFFFEEFNSRFNNIAIDYLRNPREVVGNIGESYHVATFVAAAAGVRSARSGWRGTRATRDALASPGGVSNARQRVAAALAATVIAALALEAFPSEVSDDRIVSEIAQNGLDRLVHAFRTGQLDYDIYYRTLPPRARRARRACDRARCAVDPGTGRAPWPDDRAQALGRRRDPRREPRERVRRRARSPGAEDDPRLRPLEPGGTAAHEPDRDRESHRARPRRHAVLARSASRRRGPQADEARDASRRSPRSFEDDGYETAFVYGGWGTFDDMKPFFPDNGFDEFIERDAFPEDAFRTIWGVADEYIFAKLLERQRRRRERGEAALRDGDVGQQSQPVRRAGARNRVARVASAAGVGRRVRRLGARRLPRPRQGGRTARPHDRRDRGRPRRARVRLGGDPDAELPHSRPVPRSRPRVERPAHRAPGLADRPRADDARARRDRPTPVPFLGRT